MSHPLKRERFMQRIALSTFKEIEAFMVSYLADLTVNVHQFKTEPIPNVSTA